MKSPTTKQRFDAFVVWLSVNANEVTEEDKNEIVDSFEFGDFTVEELGKPSFKKTTFFVTNVTNRERGSRDPFLAI